MTLVDTSALYALANERDLNHGHATRIMDGLLAASETLLVHNYVVVETAALLQARAGFAAAEVFLRESARFEIAWVTGDIHREAETLFGRLKSRSVSIVDCVSFTVMRQRRITTAFAFDKHFIQQGFKLAA